MNHQFRIAKRWRIFVYLMTSILSILFLLLGFFPLFGVVTNWNLYLFLLLPLSVFMTIIFLYGLVDTVVAKVIIEPAKVVQFAVFGVKELPFSHIKGYSIDRRYLRIYPSVEGLPKIKVCRYTERMKELEDLLRKRIVNLDE